MFGVLTNTIGIMEGCGTGVACRNLFKELQFLHLTSPYLLSLLMFVVQNKSLLSTHTTNQNTLFVDINIKQLHYKPGQAQRVPVG